jgi:hypothetical protein
VLRGGEEVGELLERYRRNLSMLKSTKHTAIGTFADTQSMSILTVIALAVAVLGLKYGPEDRPGFDERRPLS